MKKVIPFLIGLLMMLSAAIPASAAGVNVSITSSPAGVKAGDNVTFTVSLSGSGAATSGSVAVSFDEHFELVSGEFLKSGAMLSNFDTNTNKGALAFSSAADMNGAYFKLVLKAKTAGAAAQNVSISVELKNGGSTVGSGSAAKSVQIVCQSHSYGAYTKVNDNQHKHTCSVCGHEETANHSWNSGTVTKQPSCKDTGSKTLTCTACSSKESREVKALGHDFENPTVVKEATLSAAGLKEGKCRRCGETTKEVIPCQAKDAATGIGVEAAEGVFAEGTATNFANIGAENASYENLKSSLAEYGKAFTAYQIGFSQAPKGEYTLLFPNAAKLTADTAAVYLVGEDGTVTEKAFTVGADGTISVKTNAVGVYAVVDKAAGESSEPDANTGTAPSADNPADATPDPDNPTDSSNPPWIVLVIAGIVVIAGGGFALWWFKLRKKPET